MTKIILFQRKYALDKLFEAGMLECKPVNAPIEANVKLLLDQGES